MTSAAAVDPLDLGQRLVAVLGTGRRVATYKLATLTALIDFAVEHLPADPRWVGRTDPQLGDPCDRDVLDAGAAVRGTHPTTDDATECEHPRADESAPFIVVSAAPSATAAVCSAPLPCGT